MAAWKWGRIHYLKPVHPLAPLFTEHGALLNPPARPMDGDADTVQASGYLAGSAFLVTTTAVGRYMFDLSDWDQSGWVEPNGVSGRPGTEHYTDQVSAYLEHQFVPMIFTWPKIEAQCDLACELRPVSSVRANLK
jgi:penicillin amidase